MRGKTFFGIILIMFGVGFLLDQLGIIDLFMYLSLYWPVIIILIGLNHLFSRQKSSGSGITLILVGAFFQLRKLNLLPDDMGRYFFPALLIIIGIFIVFGRSRQVGVPIDNDDHIDHFVLFSGLENKSLSKQFNGGNITTIFGGIDFDLREANLSKEGASLDITSIFGGVELKVPNHWKVVVKGVPIFGSCEDKTITIKDDEDKTVINIKYLVVFGGVEIKN